MKKWKCTICGYIHTGEEPPEKCPVCGADKSKFVEVTAEEEAAKPAEKPAAAPKSAKAAPQPETGPKKASPAQQAAPKPKTTRERLYNLMIHNMLKHHIHPISVHVPNGVMPMVAIFLFLGIFFNMSSLALAAFYSLVFILLAMPLVVYSGVIEWQKHYGGYMSGLFFTKLVCAGVVSLCALFLVVWRILSPHVAAPDSPYRWTFFLVHLLMLAGVGVAGFLGGKLVFKD